MILWLVSSALLKGQIKAASPALSKTAAVTNDVGYFNVNRIANYFENNGLITSSQWDTDRNGMEWPQFLDTYVSYSSGLWIIGKVNNHLRSAVAEYASEFVPGAAGVPYDSLKNKIYLVSRSDLTNPHSNPDVVNWPIIEGAPWLDVNQDGIYNVDDGDHPEMLGDQMFWYVANDLDTINHKIWGTLPLHLELQTTIWGYDGTYGGVSLQDMLFVKMLLINNGPETIEEAYIGIWDDPELGDPSDDYIGCDTLSQMGFVYNDGPDAEFGEVTPALGYVLLQGPIYESPGDTARAFGRLVPDYTNYKITGFINKYDWPNGAWGMPDIDDDYRRLQGLKRDGRPIINTETNQATTFMYPGDPEQNTGLGDGIWVQSDSRESDDMQFVIGSGPVTMAPGDSQEVIIAILVTQGNGPLNSVTRLKSIAPITHTLVGQFFDIETDPAPSLEIDVQSATIKADNINDDRIINNGETFRLELSFSNTTTDTFYNLRAGFATNTDQIIVDFGEQQLIPILLPGGSYLITGEEGPQLTVTVDYPEKQFLLFATLYDSTSGLYSREEFKLSIEQLYFTPEEALYTEHILGYSDAEFQFKYVRPHEARPDSYRVDITAQVYQLNGLLGDGLGIILTNVSDNIVLLDHYQLPNEYGFDFPITEGFKLLMKPVPLDLKHLSVVANANGPLDYPRAAAAPWYFADHIPSEGGSDYYNTHTNLTIWFLHTKPSENGVDYDAFFSQMFEYTGGASAEDGIGLQHLFPHDFEIRFTEQGGKAINYWHAKDIVDIPFEVWDVGPTSDREDDYQLIPYLEDIDSNGEWNLLFDVSDTTRESGWADHGVSGAQNDPWSDPFYVLIPADTTPGSQGYENFFSAVETGEAPPPWTSTLGDNPAPLDVWNGWSKMVLVLWNGGDVTPDTSLLYYEADKPEIGTIFRISTYKPLYTGDVFTFKTEKQYVKDPTNPNQFALLQNYPNPFNAYTNLHFYLAEESDFTLILYDLLGRELIRYSIQRHLPGYHTVRWNGRSQAGRKMPSGIYFVLMKAGSFSQTGKMVLLK